MELTPGGSFHELDAERRHRPPANPALKRRGSILRTAYDAACYPDPVTFQWLLDGGLDVGLHCAEQ